LRIESGQRWRERAVFTAAVPAFLDAAAQPEGRRAHARGNGGAGGRAEALAAAPVWRASCVS